MRPVTWCENWLMRERKEFFAAEEHTHTYIYNLIVKQKFGTVGL